MEQSLTVEVITEDDRWNEKEVPFQDIAEHVLKDRPWSQPTEVTILLSNNEAVHKLNRDYRGKDKPTNVLSFPNLSQEDFAHLNQMPQDYVVHLGDVVISFNKIQEESDHAHQPFDHHLIHLTIHGILHLLGYDHVNEKDAEVMQTLEINLLKKYNIPNPYEDFNG